MTNLAVIPKPEKQEKPQSSKARPRPGRRQVKRASARDAAKRALIEAAFTIGFAEAEKLLHETREKLCRGFSQTTR